MSEGLKIANDLILPIDAVTQKFAILGTSGSGKSITAMKLAELMLDVGAQIVAIDPVGIWWSLRLAANGKSVGYEQVRVFGGDHGDLPLTKESGALVGRLLAERRFSAVLDVSQFTTGEMKCFLTEFAEQFFQSKKSHKSPVHLFLEECQTYLPQQTSDREDAKMLNRWERLIKFFRNYGGGTSMISQQPQSVNKKCLNLADTLFAMRTIGSHERKAILSWVKDVVESESDLVSNLPKLPTGVAHIWSPSWLKISRDIKVLMKRTFDAGKTPEMGVDAVEPKPLTQIDVDQLRTEMSEMIAKVKADDPRELRSQIAQLKRELSKRPTEVQTKSAPDPREISRAVNTATVPLLRQIEAMRKQAKQAIDNFARAAGPLNSIANMPATEIPQPLVLKNETVSVHTVQRPLPSRPQMVRPSREQQPSNGDLSAAQIKILSRLAELLECTGQNSVSKEQLAAWSEYTPRSGGYNNYLGSLRSAGLIEYPNPGQVTITDEGGKRAQPGEVPVTSGEMLERAKRVLGGSEARILETLHASYPEITGKVELAEATGFTPSSGGFNNYLGHMRTLGFIEYPQPGRVKAADWLFLDAA